MNLKNKVTLNSNFISFQTKCLTMKITIDTMRQSKKSSISADTEPRIEGGEGGMVSVKQFDLSHVNKKDRAFLIVV